MAILTGFPASNTISPSVRIAEKDLSFVPSIQNFNTAGIVGFASKGPVNIPTLITSTRMLHVRFGYAHPDVGDPFLVYAAEQYLLVASQVYIVRVADEEAVSDEAAQTAEVAVPGSGGQIIIQSKRATDFYFNKPYYFRYKVNDILMSKTLVIDSDADHVPDTYGVFSYSVDDLIDYLNAQLLDPITGEINSLYGITFSNIFGLLTITSTYAFGPETKIELVSVQDQAYGGSIDNIGTDVGEQELDTGRGNAVWTRHPDQLVTKLQLVAGAALTPTRAGYWSIDNPLELGVNDGMTAAIVTGDAVGYSPTYITPGSWEFPSTMTSLEFHVVVDGTDNTAIDNVVQVIDLSSLIGTTVATTDDLVDEINLAIAAADIPGGFEALNTVPGGNGYIRLQTIVKGRDAKMLVKGVAEYAIFGFPNTTASGDSVEGSSDTTITDEYGIVDGGAGLGDDTFTVTADSSGIEGNLTVVRFTNDIREGVFSCEVFNDGVQVEAWGNLTKDPSSHYYVGTFLDLVSDYIRVQDIPAVLAPPTDGDYSLSGGTDGLPSDPDRQDEMLIGSDVAFTGMYSLSEPEQVDIDLLAVPGHPSTAVVHAMLDLCQNKRQDCLAIIDPPFGLTVEEIIQWQNGHSDYNHERFDSDFGALYWPWVKIYDTKSKQYIWIPPSGSVMAVYARSDFLSAPWFAPAGITRGQVPGIIDVFNRPTLAERDAMYGNRNCINPIVQFVDLGGGFMVWGQKTLQRLPTALDRVNVRRMMFYLEKRIRRDCRTLLFEPNDFIFRVQFTNICSAILTEVQRGRGLYDWFIQCDNELNTPDVIDRNEFRARIGVQPTKAVEFIFIEFSLHRTGSFVENAETVF